MNQLPNTSKKKWNQNIVTYSNLHWRDKLLVLEIVFSLGLARLMLRILPFRHIIRLLTSAKTRPATQNKMHRIHRMGYFVRKLAPLLPWRCKCLEQAIAINLILRLRGIHCVLHLGLEKNHAELEAHAWLTCGEKTVTGHHETGKYTEIYRLQNPNDG